MKRYLKCLGETDFWNLPDVESDRMAFAEHSVLIACDAVTVYNFLLDGANLPLWRRGIRSVELASGTAGTKGAIYRKIIDGPAGNPVVIDVEITRARPGAEIEFHVVSGSVRPKGGYYLSTEGNSTRVRFALECQATGLFSLIKGTARRGIKREVVQLDRLPQVLDGQTGGAEPAGMGYFGRRADL